MFRPREQLRALTDAARAWASDNGGLYELMARVEPDCGYDDAPPEVLDLPDLFDRPLGQLGLEETSRLHAIRSMRSAVHGFVLLESNRQCQLDDDIDDRFEWMVGALIRGLVECGSPA